MLLSEFERHTGIYPDFLLWDAIRQEYKSGEWGSEEAFCKAYLDDEALAKKIRLAANDHYIAKCEMYRKALEDERKRNAELSKKLVDSG